MTGPFRPPDRPRRPFTESPYNRPIELKALSLAFVPRLQRVSSTIEVYYSLEIAVEPRLAAYQALLAKRLQPVAAGREASLSVASLTAIAYLAADLHKERLDLHRRKGVALQQR
eukprot:6212839-Pleurochrysis_carterae.AAC.6